MFGPASTLNVHLRGSGALVSTLDTVPAATTFAADGAALRQALERVLRATGMLAGEPALAGVTVSIQSDRFRVVAGGGPGADFDPSTVITFTENGQHAAADLGLLAAEANV